MSGWSGGASGIVPSIVRAFAAAQTVSTETPLMALTELGPTYSWLTITLRNHDTTKNAALYVDTSESGIVVASGLWRTGTPPCRWPLRRP